MSRDGSLIATTSFVTGHAYSDTSFLPPIPSFSEPTATWSGVSRDSPPPWMSPLTEVDRNYWGVTFVDDDTFYATAASSAIGKTWLVKGSISERTMTSVRTDAECPSIAPDSTRVAYKTRHGNPAPGHWNIAVLNWQRHGNHPCGNPQC